MADRYDDVIKEATEALRLNPNDAAAYTNRGTARGRRKDQAGAVADHSIALRLSPKNYLAWSNRGWAYYQMGEYRQGLADLEEAVRLRPDYAHARSNRGACLLHLGEYAKALADYEAAAKLERLRPGRWWRVVAALRAHLGDPAGAAAAQAEADRTEGEKGRRVDFVVPPPPPPLKVDPP
jgi:tetratricopeptide (TPR) repeat protein